MLLYLDRLEPAEQARRLARYLPTLRQPVAVHFHPTMPATQFPQAVTDHIGARAVRYPSNSPAELQRIGLYHSHILERFAVEGFLEKARTPAPEPAVAMESARQHILRLHEKSYTQAAGIAAVLKILSNAFGPFAVHGTCAPELAYVFDFSTAMRRELPALLPRPVRPAPLPPNRRRDHRPRQQLISPQASGSEAEPPRFRSIIFRRARLPAANSEIT